MGQLAGNYIDYTVTRNHVTTGNQFINRQCVLTGLQDGVTYNFRVKATNARGDSTWSNTIQTFSGTIPQIPTNLHSALTADFQSCDIRWDESVTCGWGVSGCQVEIQWHENVEIGNGRIERQERYAPATRYCQQTAVQSGLVADDQYYVSGTLCTIPLSRLESDFYVGDGQGVYARVKCRN